MSIFPWVSKSKVTHLEQTVKALQTTNILHSVQALTTIFPTYGVVHENEAYRTVDDIYSIVTFLAETSALIPMYGYKVVKDQPFKQYKTASGIHKRYFHTKALEDLPETNATAKFIERFSFEERVALYINLYLNGEVFIYLDLIEVGPNAGQYIPILVPGQFMQVAITDSWPYQVAAYRYQDSRTTIDFNVSEVIHIKYSNPDPYNENKWRGFSPISALRRRITRINSSLNVSVAQMQNGGLPGVIYEKDLGSGDLGKRKDDFAKFLNNTDNKSAPYWIDGELGYIQTGSPLADMQIAELSNVDFKKLCNAWRMPAQLLNNDDGAKYDNMDASEKRLHTNAILPNVYRVRDGLNRGLGLKAKGEYIEADISDIPALQENMKTQAEALKIMEWITYNEKREIQKFDRSDNPVMDEIIIGNSNMLLNDLEAVPDNEVTKDYENR